MRVAASVENLWQYIQSLSLSERNRKWLAGKLLENTHAKEECEYISKEEILAGIDAGLKDMKVGRKRSFEDFMKEWDEEESQG